MEGTQLRYVIKFVADMNKAVKFYRDVLEKQRPGKYRLHAHVGAGELMLKQGS